MYGLKKSPKFDFDLEKEIKAKPERKKELLSSVQKHSKEIKETLRKEKNSKELESLSTILQGYVAAEKVINGIK